MFSQKLPCSTIYEQLSEAPFPLYPSPLPGGPGRQPGAPGHLHLLTDVLRVHELPGKVNKEKL